MAALVSGASRGVRKVRESNDDQPDHWPDRCVRRRSFRHSRRAPSPEKRHAPQASDVLPRLPPARPAPGQVGRIVVPGDVLAVQGADPSRRPWALARHSRARALTPRGSTGRRFDGSTVKPLIALDPGGKYRQILPIFSCETRPFTPISDSVQQAALHDQPASPDAQQGAAPGQYVHQRVSPLPP